MNPLIKKNLDGVLGNSFVEHNRDYGGPIHPWGYDHRQEDQAKRESGFYQARKTNPEVALMTPQEFEEWKKANGLPPTVRSTGVLGGPVPPVPVPKYDRSIFGGNDSNTPVPFPKYDWGERAPGWGPNPGVKTMEWNYERDGQNPLAGFGPIGAYNPDTDESKVVPLDFLNNFLDERLLAKGKSPFSTPYWDKQDDIRKYLDNDKRLIESLIRRGKIKV